MLRPARQNDRLGEPLIQRLDRAAGEINPFLMVLAIGLLILYLTCLFALVVLNMPITRMSPGEFNRTGSSGRQYSMSQGRQPSRYIPNPTSADTAN